MSDAVHTTRATYALIAQTFAGVQSSSDAGLEEDLDWLASAMPGGVVADIGCGPGRDTLALRSRGLRVVGLDLSDTMLRARGLSGVAQADMRALPVRGRSLAAIWCHAALLHIPHAYAQPVLSEFARAVRPGGVLHLAVAEGDGEGYEVASQYGTDAQRWFAYHREEGLTALCADAGFEVMHVRRWTAYRAWLGLRARRAPA